MQNDLISRKELIERIVNREGCSTVLCDTTEELNAYLNGYADNQNDIIDIINEQPTAYDVKKVIEDIKEYDRKCYGEISTVRVLSIVRKGGVE